MSDWLDAARGRFEFLRRVAELHGCAVRVGTWSDEEWLGGAVAEEKRIFINLRRAGESVCAARPDSAPGGSRHFGTGRGRFVRAHSAGYDYSAGAGALMT